MEPVAWMDEGHGSAEFAFSFEKGINHTIPLYTAPRELSDEEIEQVGKTNDGVLKLFYMIQGDMTGLQFKEALNDFARAILKKASEK